MKVNVTGGWIELRDAEEVPERLRRPIVSTTMSGIPLQADMEGIMSDPASADPVKLARFMEFTSQFGDLVALAFVKAWSFDAPITSESVQDLPAKVFDEVQAAIAPLVPALLPNFGVDPDPKAPTDNSIA